MRKPPYQPDAAALDRMALSGILATWFLKLDRRFPHGEAKQVADAAIGELVRLLVAELEGLRGKH